MRYFRFSLLWITAWTFYETRNPITLSDPELASGNLMWTPPQSSIIDWINLPPAPMIVLCIFAGMMRSQLTWRLKEKLFSTLLNICLPHLVMWFGALIRYLYSSQMVFYILTTSACSDWICCIFFWAFKTSSFLPVKSITSESEPLAGRSTLALVSWRICLIVAPPLPMINLWNCLKMGNFS